MYTLTVPNIAHLRLHHADDLDVEIVQVLLFLQVDLILAGVHGLTELLWPVLVTFDPSPFYFLRHHGDDVGFVLPHHLPERRHRGGQRTLAGDVEELLASNLHADVAGVDVVLVLSDGDAGFVVCGGTEEKGKTQSVRIVTAFSFTSESQTTNTAALLFGQKCKH